MQWEWFVGLWEELLDKFAQACLTNGRKLPIRAAEVDMSAYRQLRLQSECWAPEQPTERSAHGLLENCSKFCPELMGTCAERWITCIWNNLLIGAFCLRGAAQEGLQSPSCPANSTDNSWFHCSFCHPLSEPGVGVLSNEDERDGSGSVFLWPRSSPSTPIVD